MIKSNHLLKLDKRTPSDSSTGHLVQEDPVIFKSFDRSKQTYYQTIKLLKQALVNNATAEVGVQADIKTLQEIEDEKKWEK